MSIFDRLLSKHLSSPGLVAKHTILKSRFGELYQAANIPDYYYNPRVDKQNKKEEQKVLQMFQQFEQLSKDDFPNIELLAIKLLEESYFISSAPVFKRLAITFRKEKDYDSEIDAIQIFLDVYQPQYGGAMWKDVFEPRLKKARTLASKSVTDGD